jgi:DNA-directed RNA polymerase specialized sigma24 family protein
VERKHRGVGLVVPAGAASDDSVVVWQALLRLPERQRAALALRFYEDLPEAEIAVILDCPVGTVKSYVHRGIERMRGALGPAFQIGSSESSEGEAS